MKIIPKSISWPVSTNMIFELFLRAQKMHQVLTCVCHLQEKGKKNKNSMKVLPKRADINFFWPKKNGKVEYYYRSFTGKVSLGNQLLCEKSIHWQRGSTFNYKARKFHVNAKSQHHSCGFPKSIMLPLVLFLFGSHQFGPVVLDLSDSFNILDGLDP